MIFLTLHKYNTFYIYLGKSKKILSLTRCVYIWDEESMLVCIDISLCPKYYYTHVFELNLSVIRTPTVLNYSLFYLSPC